MDLGQAGVLPQGMHAACDSGSEQMSILKLVLQHTTRSCTLGCEGFTHPLLPEQPCGP